MIDSINFKATDWNKVCAYLIYNMDKLGTDPSKHTDVMSIPKEVLNRIFQSTPEGDKINLHLTVAMFSHSDGKYKDEVIKIEGCPMQLFIYSSPEDKDSGNHVEKRISLYKEQDTVAFNTKRFNQGFTNDDKLIGLTLRSFKNGSMTKELFLDAIIHFIKHLPSDQDANGKYIFLLLDSHVSRWNPIAFYLLFKNRIILVSFSSHLFIVV